MSFDDIPLVLRESVGEWLCIVHERWAPHNVGWLEQNGVDHVRLIIRRHFTIIPVVQS